MEAVEGIDGQVSTLTRKCQRNNDASNGVEASSVFVLPRRYDEPRIPKSELDDCVRFLYSLVFAPFTVRVRERAMAGAVADK